MRLKVAPVNNIVLYPMMEGEKQHKKCMIIHEESLFCMINDGSEPYNYGNYL